MPSRDAEEPGTGALGTGGAAPPPGEALTAPDAGLLGALGRAELFSKLRPETLTAVAALASPRRLDAGEWIFHEGDPGEYVFVIERGWAEATRRSESGREVPLRALGPGEVGGVTSLVGDRKRSASLRALEPSSLILINKRALLALTASHADLLEALVGFLGSKVRKKTGRLVRLITGEEPDGRSRVAFFDTKPYDRMSFEPRLPASLGATWFETRLGPATAGLAAGHQIACAFVNDDVSAPVVELLVAHGVELLALRCAGYNNVDIEAAARVNLSVVRVPAYSPHAVAEHAMALILALNRKLHRAYNRVREGNFSLGGLVGFDLFGRTAGVVGLGKIGRALAEILRGFGMRVLAADAYHDAAYAAQTGVSYVELDQLLAESDVVSLHTPLTPETYHLIDARRMAQMKRGAVLINTSRGGLVSAKALIDALKSGHLGAAGLDVYEEESGYFFEDRSDRVITDDVLARLMTFPNVLITSHQAFLTDEALAQIADTTLQNISEFLAGQRGRALTNAVVTP